MIDANDLERMAKERPDDCFLKGSGILKLTGSIRQLEGELRVAIALLSECVGPLEVSAAVIESEDGDEAIETLIERVKAFVAASYLKDAYGTQCRKCGGAMKRGNAIPAALIAGDEGTISEGAHVGPAPLAACMKCEACGWSVTSGEGPPKTE